MRSFFPSFPPESTPVSSWSSGTAPAGSSRPGAGALWNFALERYARPGAEALCLTLQDVHGFDVCELLWIAWLAERGLEPPADIDGALSPVRRWQREMTLALRERRRALKPQVAAVPSLEALRQSLKQAELEAERETLRQLEVLSGRELGVLSDRERQTPPGREKENATNTTIRAVTLCHRLAKGEVSVDADLALRELMMLWVANARDAEPNGGC